MNVFAQSPYDAGLGVNVPQQQKPDGDGTVKGAFDRIASQYQVPVNVLFAMEEIGGDGDSAGAVSRAEENAAHISGKVKAGGSVDDALSERYGAKLAPKVMSRAYDIADMLYPREGQTQPGAVSDFFRRIGGSLVNSGGSALRAIGLSVDSAINAALPKPMEVDDTALSRLSSAGADAVQRVGENLQQSVSQASKQAIAGSQPGGSVFDPSSWSLGDNPSLRGYVMQGADVLGSLLPVVITAAATRNPYAAAAVGGEIGGGAGAEQARDAILEMAQTKGPNGRPLIETESKVYRDAIASGMTPQQALDHTVKAAERFAFLLTAPVSALGGAATEKILSPAAGKLLGASMGVRAAGIGGLSALEEGSQEVGETIASRSGMNLGAGTDQSITDGTFGDFLLGAMGGVVPGVAGGAVARPDPAEIADKPVQSAQQAPSGTDAMFGGIMGGGIASNLSGTEGDGSAPPVPDAGAPAVDPFGDGAPAPTGAPVQQEPGLVDPEPVIGAPPAGPIEALAQMAPPEMVATPEQEPAGLRFPDQKPGKKIRIATPDGAVMDAVFLREEPGAVVVRVAGDEIAIEDTQFDAALIAGQRADEATKEAAKEAKKAAKATAPKGKKPKLSEQAMAGITPPPAATEPQMGKVDMGSTMTAEEARRRMKVIEDNAAVSGWDKRKVAKHAELEDIANGAAAKPTESPFDAPAEALKDAGFYDIGTAAQPERPAPDPVPGNIEEINIAPAAPAERIATTDAAEVAKMAKMPVAATPADTPPATAQEATPRPAAAPMKPASERLQLDLLGGKAVTEDQMAVKERRKREWGRFLAIAEAGKPWIGDLEAASVKLSAHDLTITGPNGSRTTATDGMSREDIGGWARRAMQNVGGFLPDEQPEAAKQAPAAPSATEIKTAAKEADRNPTEAQKEAGNYKMGHILWNGLDITIENAKGSIRRGKDADGEEWSVKMPAHYGYIKRTEGADGDHIDVYMGDNPESDKVFVVDQVDAKTKAFDEHKVMLGFLSVADAEVVYLAGFSDGKGRARLGAMTHMTVDELKAALKDREAWAKGPLGRINAAASSSDMGTAPLAPVSWAQSKAGDLLADGSYMALRKAKEKWLAKGVAVAIGGRVMLDGADKWAVVTDARPDPQVVADAVNKAITLHNQTDEEIVAKAAAPEPEAKPAARPGYSWQGTDYSIQTKVVGRYQVGRGPKGAAVSYMPPDLDGVAQEPVTFARFAKDVDEAEIEKAIADDKARRAPPKADRKMLGYNARSRPLYEDENGVRYYVENGVRVSEAVGVIPGGGIEIKKDQRGRDYLTKEEFAEKAQPEGKTVESSQTEAPEAEGKKSPLLTKPKPQTEPAPAKSTLSVLSQAEQDRAALLRARIAERLKTQMNSGLDPELVRDAVELVGIYIKAGLRRFRHLLDQVAADMGIAPKDAEPWIRAAYNQARDDMELADSDISDMDDAKTVLSEVRSLRSGSNLDSNSAIIEATPPQEPATDGRELVQDGERETANQSGIGDGEARDLDLAQEQPEDGGAPGKRKRSGSRRARSGGQDAGRGDDLFGGGDAAPGREGTGGTGVADAGTGNGPRNLGLTRGNYVIADPEAIIGGTPMVRFNRNRAAIEAFNDITADGREPTTEELDAMAGYIGWGSFGQELFQGSWERPRPKQGWEERDTWLRDQLGEAAWKSAQASIINAHYTDPPTVQAMWAMVEAMGFKGGRVLEPSMGIGNFFGLMPQHLAAKSTLTGIELDQTTGGMAKLLYPEANIQIKGYEKSQTPDNFYDLVIGNWPFAKDGPVDRRYAKLSASLHDYFFVKALDQVRPGGIVIGITSAGTMDKQGKAVRDHLARNAELVAAYRLPSGAFEKYAGTAVVTDIIVLKKREAPTLDASASGWLDSVEMDTPAGTPIRVNQYFHDHPDHVLGRLNFGSGTTYGKAAMIVERPADLMDRLQALPQRVPQGIMSDIRRGKEARFLTNNTTDRNGSIVARDGKLWAVRGERLVELDLHSKKDAKGLKDAVSALVDIRRAYGATIDAERDGARDTETKRAELNRLYQKFHKAYGPIRKSAALKLLKAEDDPNVPMLTAIERVDGTPSAVLTEAIVRTKADIKNPSVSDAYVIARNEAAHLDLARVAELAKTEEKKVAEELLNRGAIYRMPGGTYEISDLFLSGNVRRRLAQLQNAFDAGETELQPSIDAIKKVVPEDIPYFKIEANMGAAWIGGDTFRGFTAEILGLDAGQRETVLIQPIGGTWNVKFTDRHLLNKPEATTQHGMPEVDFDRILRAALNNETLNIKTRDEDGKPVTNEALTKAAADKVEKLRETFRDWVWKDATRRVDLAKAYNDAMNAIAEPRFDGSFLEFPGMALRRGDQPFNLRQHQVNAIWRGIASGRGIYAHEVGTGKTYTMGGIAIESRRYGLARKPMIVAHNANSASVAREIGEMYPGARILYVDNLSPETIKETLYSIRNDDWDAVVVPHSLLDRFSLSPDTIKALAAEDIASLEDAALKAAAEDNVSLTLDDMNDDEKMKKLRSVTAKELVKARNAIYARIDKAVLRSTREDAVTFEDLGIDQLLIDEIHEFKKPAFVTKMRMKGLQTATSDRALQLQFLTRYIRKANGGRGVHAFTGTPITNTMTEMFHQMRFVMEDVMDQSGVGDWDSWFNTFATAEADMELASDGQFETVTRLSSFVNVAELRRMAGEFLDIVFADDMPEFSPRKTASGKTMADDLTGKELKELRDGRTENAIGRPYKKIINDTAEMNDAQMAVQRDLARRYNAFRQANKKTRYEIIKKKGGDERNPLLISLEADAAAFDIRLRNPERADSPTSKVNRAIKNVMTHYREHPLATQVIFMDKGYENFGEQGGVKVARLNIAADIKAKLMAAGVPESEIAIVKGSTSKEKRKELADKVNRAEIRVIIGGTQTLGVGVNMQANLRAMHHLDAPWMPGELEQRNGRGQRQGNAWNTVLEYRYMTERLDGKRWQALAKKQRFITDFMKSDFNTRIIDGDAVDMSEEGSADDVTASLSEAAGDPRIMQLAKAKMSVDKLRRRQSNHDQGIVDAGRRAERLRKTAADLREEQARAEDDAAHAATVREAKSFEMTIDGKQYAERAEAIEALDTFMETWRVPAAAMNGWIDVPVEFNGFKVKVKDDWRGAAYALQRRTQWRIGKVSVASMETNLRNIPQSIEESARQITETEASAARLEKAAGEPFAQADLLAKREAQVVALEADMVANPVAAPAWLRQGAPTETKVWVGGTAHTVTGHRWGPDTYYVLTEDGDFPYDKVKGQDGARIYDPVAWREPPTAAERAKESRFMPGAEGAMGLTALEARIADLVKSHGLDGKITIKMVKGLIGERGAEIAGRHRAGEIALNPAAGDVVGVARHEIIHALRGAFSAGEWSALVAAARRNGAIVASVEAAYPDAGPEAQAEEMVAELYRTWTADGSANSRMAALMGRLRRLFEAIGNALRGSGFITAAGVIDRIASGEVGARIAAAGAAPAEMRIDLLKSKAKDLIGSDHWRKPDKEFFSDVMTDAMAGKMSVLALVPGRALFSEMGKRLLAAQAYLRGKEEMDALRNHWHSVADDTAQRWLKLRRADPTADAAMMDLMHEATLAQVDPSKPLTIREPFEKAAQEAVSRYGIDNPEIKWAADVVKRVEAKKRAYLDIRAKFSALPEDFQSLFREVASAYDGLGDAFEKAVLDNMTMAQTIAIKRAERIHRKELRRIADEGLEGEELDRAIEEADAALKRIKDRGGWGLKARIAELRKTFEGNRLKGPYFPLARFGQYFVTIRNDRGQVISFSKFEKRADQRRAIEEAEAEHPGLVQHGTIGDAEALRDQVDPTFVADIQNLLAGTDTDPAVMDAIWQRWLETLPDQSIRTSHIHRKGRQGFTADAYRAFGSHMFHGAHQLARLEYGLQLEEHLNDAEEEAARQANPERALMVVNEMRKRHAFTMNPSGSAFAAGLGGLAFVWYLAATPAAALANLTQTTVVGAPVMAARFRKSGLKGVMGQLGQAVKDLANGKGHVDKSARLTAEEHAAMRFAIGRGAIDKTQAHDLAAVAETGVEYSGVREKWMKRLSFFFHHAERVNREITFLAAYRLARAEGLDHMDAQEAAIDMTWKVHFDYQNTSRPRLMQNDALRLLTTFRQFTINMLWRLFRDSHQALRGATKEERAEAKRQLIGISLSLFAHAGIRGVWGYGIMMTLLGMFFPGGSDDAEEWLQDALLLEGDSAGTAAWNYIMGAALNGAPGQIAQIDLRERIGMPNLWFRSPSKDLEGDDLYNFWLGELVGPVGGLAESGFRAAQYMADGDIWRGVETASPKALRDIMKATRYATDGVQTRNGDTILDSVNPWLLAMQSIGFTPAKIAERYEINTRLMNAEKRIMDERKEIHQAAGEAIAAGEGMTDDIVARIRDFNARFPEYPITTKTIQQSLKARQRMSERREFGVALNPKLNDRLRGERAPAVYN